MDLQLLVAINLMSLSALAIIAILMQRSMGFVSWIATHAVVVIVGVVALVWSPRWSGTIVATASIPLVFAPSLLVFLAQRYSLSNRKRKAAFCCQLLSYLHPTAPMRFVAAAAKAQLQPTIDAEVAALRELGARTSPGRMALLQASIARAQDDWQGVLENLQRQNGTASDLKALEVRALGEIGRTDEMVRMYAAAKSKLIGAHRYLSQLFVLAFCGRRESVKLLLEQRLSVLAPEAKDYWTAIAAKAAGTDDEWRRLFGQLADAPEDTTSRRSARRHLALAQAKVVLTPESLTVVNATEDWLRRQPQRRKLRLRHVPVTAALVVLIAATFALEWVRGGLGNARTLIELGALWAPLVLHNGEWWRLLTALFLHQDWLHLGSNLFLLLVFGWLYETSLGSIRTLVVYLVGGVASSACVLWLMWTGAASYGVMVGASGAIFALVGAELVRRLFEWLRSRDTVDLRGLIILASALLIEVAVDLNVTEISFAGHAAGFVTGVALGLVMVIAKTSRTRTAELRTKFFAFTGFYAALARVSRLRMGVLSTSALSVAVITAVVLLGVPKVGPDWTTDRTADLTSESIDLGFAGTIYIDETASECRYRIPVLTIRPLTREGRLTQSIQLDQLRVYANRTTNNSGELKQVFARTYPLRASLTFPGAEVRIKNVEFAVPKSVRGESIGLSVVGEFFHRDDGRYAFLGPVERARLSRGRASWTITAPSNVMTRVRIPHSEHTYVIRRSPADPNDYCSSARIH
jgi:membrane associated rhomboid family serine protease